jgi:ParB family chromosome partitioning protein
MSNTDTPLTDAGTLVVDRDAASQHTAVVINSPPTATIDDWYVPGGHTVADDNPTYLQTDRVVVVAYRGELAQHYPHYCGVKPLELQRVHRSGLRTYAFPESRLRAVGTIEETADLPLAELRPSPYHARNFTAADNDQYIRAIRQHGRPKDSLLVRIDRNDRFEILNGHKRAWASSLAGLDTVPCRCVYLADDDTAARTWARRHLGEYTEFEQAVARDRLTTELGAAGDRIVADHAVEEP